MIAIFFLGIAALVIPFLWVVWDNSSRIEKMKKQIDEWQKERLK